MFIPNTTAQLYTRVGRSAFGRASFGTPTPIPCAIVDLGDLVTPSAVRADQSATKGAAEIDTLKATILVPATIKVRNGDVLVIQGFFIEVDGSMPKLNVLGKLDHWELTGNIKGDFPS